MIRHLIAALALLAVAELYYSAHAARVSPMILEVTPVGRGSIARLELTNDTDRDKPYEIRMMAAEISEDGELSLSPADEDFFIFPTQTIVEANSQQVFRIQYVGDPELAKSEIYYATVKQIPVGFDGTGGQIEFVINYNVLVNVVPEGTVPEAAVDQVQITTLDEQTGFNVRVSNTGSRYFLAGQANWRITATAEDGTEFSFNYRNNEMSQIIGAGVVVPGHARKFFVPTDKPLLQETVRVEVDF